MSATVCHARARARTPRRELDRVRSPFLDCAAMAKPERTASRPPARARRQERERSVAPPPSAPPSAPSSTPSSTPPGPARLRTVALVLAATWAMAFAPQLFLARGFVIGDASNLRAYAEHSAAEWREHHRRALWNPYVFGGIASAASLQDS